jgi:hypothetical protein
MLLIVKAGGTYSYHLALRVKRPYFLLRKNLCLHGGQDDDADDDLAFAAMQTRG